jgi:hypothetical protein
MAGFLFLGLVFDPGDRVQKVFVLQWLNENAGALQALGSIAAAVFTLVLIAITWQYVRLTKNLADVAYAQSFLNLQLKFDYKVRVWSDYDKLMIQVDWINRNAITICIEDMFISAFYPTLVRPIPKRLSLFRRLVPPGQSFGLATDLDSAYIPIVKQTEKNLAGSASTSPNTYYFKICLNFTDVRGAVQHCCFWTDIGTIHYQQKFYQPPNLLSRWLQERRDAKERRRVGVK